MIELTLPFPKRELSPNTRISWQAKMVHVKEARESGKIIAIEYKNTHQGKNWDLYELCDFHLFLKFYPPDRRRRDLDNLFAAEKAYLDGICIGIGIDDSQFRDVTLSWGNVEKPGKVVVRIGVLNDK
jgi:crossover junction endodeoxyribonuclease RusA